MKRMKDYGDEASCSQLSVKYGETKNFYNSNSIALAQRVCDSMKIKPATKMMALFSGGRFYMLDVMQKKMKMADLFGN